MHKGFIKWAAVLGGLAVLLGAFGAHQLKSMFSDHAIQIFETGVRYQFYHVFALLLTALLYKDFSNQYMRWAGYLFIAGIFLFSFSLYLLTYVTGAVQSGFKWVGPITPIGGLCFLAGWVFLLVGANHRHGSLRKI